MKEKSLEEMRDRLTKLEALIEAEDESARCSMYREQI